MKNHFNKIYLFVLVLFFGLNGYAQLFPVQLTPVFKSPYSVKISDYATSMDTKFQLLINPTDVTISQRQVRLKLYIQGNGVNIRSSDYITVQRPIFINGGEFQTLTNTDISALFRLENLQGITSAQYANPLPDGMYEFCFEMYDYITNQKISQKSCASIYLILNDPPLLNTPQKNEQIAASDFPNIMFTWTPRQMNATNVSYKFELKQLIDPTLDPQFAFQMSPLLYEETVFSTAMLYNLSMPILTPGMRYAWRVKAISTTGLSENAIFKNDGYSEIYSFKYTASCAAPTFLLSEAISPTSVKITWQGIPDHTKYQLQYKKQDVRNAQWFSTNSLNTQSLITNLEPGVTYQFRVGSSCDPATEGVQSFTYSEISTFTTPTQTNGVPSFNCGIIPKINIQNQKPLTNLIQSETFTAGDFPVTVLELKGENSPYSGKGYIIVPYLADTKIAVEFNNITINTDYQLISGVVETSYNPDWNNITELEDFTGEGQSGKIKEEISFEIDKIIINANGDIVVNGKNGEQVIIPGGKDTVITDNSGKTYYVDKDGNGSNEGIAQAQGGKPTPENTDGVDKNGQAIAFTAQGISIVFSNIEDANDGAISKYAFDVMPNNNSATLEKLYKKVGNVALPYKAVVNGNSDTVLATISHTDTNIKLDSIVFKTESGGKIDFVRNDKTFTLTVKGKMTYAEEQILATIKQGDKWKLISAFILVHISPKEVNLALVPLNDSQIPANTENDITSIYKKVGVKLNISRSEKINYTDLNGKIEVGDTDFLATYTSDQQVINNLIKKADSYKTDTYYLIYSDLPASKNDIEGFMPLKGQFGYVFSNTKTKIPSHELGHGVLGLEHPFKNKAEEGKTNFLMDYGNGLNLWHNDWKQINDPKFKLYLFQNDSEGEYETDGHYSTVYLVSLMLGMNPDKAWELAKATEAPDTVIHNETKYEINDTWADATDQESIHSLTGGYHGIEEFLSAIQFLYTSKEDMIRLGELLHRFGDSYAHTKLDNLKPESLSAYNLKENKNNEIIAIESWKNWTGENLSNKIEPWILYFNYYFKKYGIKFLKYPHLQRETFHGKTLNEVLKDIYLVKSTDKFIMYGGKKNIFGLTDDHAFSDGLKTDMIYLRPEWYLDYVKNLAWLISKKYDLKSDKFNISTFERMTKFAVSNSCSLKGIIDYEIAKFKLKKEVYIPVFYASGIRAASVDAGYYTNYLDVAKDALTFTKKYIKQNGGVLLNEGKESHKGVLTKTRSVNGKFLGTYEIYNQDYYIIKFK